MQEGDDASLERLDRQLAMSSSILGDCAALIRDLDLNAHENIRRIGETLQRLFAIQRQIYELRPDLTPEYLKKEWNRPMSATEGREYQLWILAREVNSLRLYLEYLERQIHDVKKRAYRDSHE